MKSTEFGGRKAREAMLKEIDAFVLYLHNIKKDRILSNARNLCILLCLVAVIAALLINGLSKTLPPNMVNSETVYIKSERDLIKLGESIYNDKLILQNDIRITDSSFRIGSNRPCLM